MTRSFHAHRSIEYLDKYCRTANLPLKVISFTDHESKRYLTIPIFFRNTLNPILLIRQILINRDIAYFIVREFLTLPLVFSIPFTFYFRKRVLWVINHNLQRAHQRKRDKLSFTLLFMLGYRFISLESDAGIDALKIKPKKGQSLTVPLPLPEDLFPYSLHISKRRPDTAPVIGIIGSTRKEKKQYELYNNIKNMISTNQIYADLLIGVNDNVLLKTAFSDGFRAINTDKIDAYIKAILDSDILVFSFSEIDYYYRPSASVHDALALHRPVVCPNFPIIRKQITDPVRVGYTYDDKHDLLSAIRSAIDFSRNCENDFIEYSKGRRNNIFCSLKHFIQ